MDRENDVPKEEIGRGGVHHIDASSLDHMEFHCRCWVIAAREIECFGRKVKIRKGDWSSIAHLICVEIDVFITDDKGAYTTSVYKLPDLP